ncbi:hypothetical protein PGTUg99_002097 [Puccinia graminis f. sp. tritici]|uniref:Uncharacterized protein n=1 Tax=Puccinia graminis f. sp. tritici TaxID=56615 RepID=A0A5B0NLZ1_PUCGR|nr:hypothetical protein PGTUg99_002097 [Puccinia graminis f. sp. tritici]
MILRPISTTLSPQELLMYCHEVGYLTIPHIGIIERQFVLDPLIESVDPSLWHADNPSRDRDTNRSTSGRSEAKDKQLGGNDGQGKCQEDTSDQGAGVSDIGSD